MQRDWLNYLMEASTSARPGGSASEASSASPALGRTYQPEEQGERNIARSNIFIHPTQSSPPQSASSMSPRATSGQLPSLTGGGTVPNISAAPAGNQQRVNPASYASLGLSGLSAAALLASRSQEQGEMQPQANPAGSYGGDLRAEVMELRGMLERARGTINDLNRAILRYEDENSKLRRLVEELTRVDMGRGAFAPRMDDHMRTGQPNMYAPPGYAGAPPHQEHMRAFHDPHNMSPRPSPMFADSSRQLPTESMRPLAQPPPTAVSVGPASTASAAASRGGGGQGGGGNVGNANCDYSSGSERGSVSSVSEGPGSKKRPRAEGTHAGEEQGARRNGEGEGHTNKGVKCAAFVSTSSLSSDGAEGGDKKYRKSCDFCTTTKIRCDGLKPTCENCSKRSLKCNYSERKRPGPKIMGSSNDSVGARSRSSLPLRSPPGPVYARGPPAHQPNTNTDMSRPMTHEDPQRHRMQGTHSEAAAILMKLPGSMRGPREHEVAYGEMPPGSGYVPAGMMPPHNPAAPNWAMPLGNHTYGSDDRNTALRR